MVLATLSEAALLIAQTSDQETALADGRAAVDTLLTRLFGERRSQQHHHASCALLIWSAELTGLALPARSNACTPVDAAPVIRPGTP